MRKFLCLSALVGMLCALTGCHRSEDAYDNRTLEQRSHVETTHPEDRKDPFRP